MSCFILRLKSKRVLYSFLQFKYSLVREYCNSGHLQKEMKYFLVREHRKIIHFLEAKLNPVNNYPINYMDRKLVWNTYCCWNLTFQSLLLLFTRSLNFEQVVPKLHTSLTLMSRYWRICSNISFGKTSKAIFFHPWFYGLKFITILRKLAVKTPKLLGLWYSKRSKCKDSRN